MCVCVWLQLNPNQSLEIILLSTTNREFREAQWEFHMRNDSKNSESAHWDSLELKWESQSCISGILKAHCKVKSKNSQSSVRFLEAQNRITAPQMEFWKGDGDSINRTRNSGIVVTTLEFWKKSGRAVRILAVRWDFIPFWTSVIFLDMWKEFQNCRVQSEFQKSKGNPGRDLAILGHVGILESKFLEVKCEFLKWDGNMPRILDKVTRGLEEEREF